MPALDHRGIPWREPEVWLAEVRGVRTECGKLREAAIDNGMALGRLWLEGKAHHRPPDSTVKDFAKTAFGVDDPSFLNRCARVFQDRERLPEARLWWETEAADAGWKPIPSGTGGLDWAAKILKAHKERERGPPHLREKTTADLGDDAEEAGGGGDEGRVQELQGEVEGLRDDLLDKDREIAALKARLAERDAAMAALREENARLRAEIERLKHGPGPDGGGGGGGTPFGPPPTGGGGGGKKRASRPRQKAPPTGLLEAGAWVALREAGQGRAAGEVGRVEHPLPHALGVRMAADDALVFLLAAAWRPLPPGEVAAAEAAERERRVAATLARQRYLDGAGREHRERIAAAERERAEKDRAEREKAIAQVVAGGAPAWDQLPFRIGETVELARRLGDLPEGSRATFLGWASPAEDRAVETPPDDPRKVLYAVRWQGSLGLLGNDGLDCVSPGYLGALPGEPDGGPPAPPPEPHGPPAPEPPGGFRPGDLVVLDTGLQGLPRGTLGTVAANPSPKASPFPNRPLVRVVFQARQGARTEDVHHGLLRPLPPPFEPGAAVELTDPHAKLPRGAVGTVEVWPSKAAMVASASPRSAARLA